ncbi:putative GTP-binding protein EngA [Helianthus debilis subsp. tardiflorus]
MSLAWLHALSRRKTRITTLLQKNLIHNCVRSEGSTGLQFNKGSLLRSKCLPSGGIRTTLLGFDTFNIVSHFHHSTLEYRRWFSTIPAQDDVCDDAGDLGAKLESGKPVEFSKVDTHLLPTVLLIGRPNVGKSALFNRLIRRREALVYNTPNDHVTRDIREGIAKLGDLRFKVLDSAGLEAEASSGSVLGRTAEMTANVLRRCKFALFLIDARDGLQPMDLDVGKWLRKHAPEIKIITVMNKAESLDDGFGSVISAASEACTLGFGDPVALSAETGLGMNDLYEVLRPLLEQHMLQTVDEGADETNEECEEESKLPLQLAFVGRPNVGKSTLLNAILQEERVLVGPEAGLTRDSVRVEFKFEGRTIYMVDTAGWLQRTKSEKGASSLSIVQSRKNLMRAHVVALVLDGQEVSKARKSLTHDEVVIARRAIEEGRGLVVIVNKMDLLEQRLCDRVVKAVPQEIQTIIPQVTGIPVVFVSALEGKGRIEVMQQVIETYKKWCLRLSTARLNRWLLKVMSRHSWKDLAAQPKVKYFTQVKARPPTFVAFVSGKTRLSDTDLRFLTRSLKEDFDMGGIPVRILQRTVVKNAPGSNKTNNKKYAGKLAAGETSDKRILAVDTTT